MLASQCIGTERGIITATYTYCKNCAAHLNFCVFTSFCNNQGEYKREPESPLYSETKTAGPKNRARHNNSYIYVPRIVFISNFVSGCVFTSFYKGDYKGAPENHLLIWKPNKRKQIVHFKVKIDISLIFMLFNFLVRTLHSTERLLFSRNRNLMGSANLLSIYSLVTT